MIRLIIINHLTYHCNEENFYIINPLFVGKCRMGS